jgi:hypothetical protein
MAKANKTETLIAYKGFDAQLRCRNYQYAIGESYEHTGKVEPCESGFHACEYPLDVLRYYAAAGSRFAVVEQSGTLARHDEDSKIASSRISIKAEIDLPGLIKAAVEYTLSRTKPAEGAQNAKPKHSVANSGYRGAATNSGDRGAATNSGDRGAATNSGDSGAATNSGDSGAATNSGYRGAATNSGYRGAATNSGYRGAATNSGDSGAATNSGDSGAATNSGYSGAATNSGYRGAATNSGYSGAATNSGYRGAATNSGKHGVACDFSGTGRVKSCEGGAIVLIHRKPWPDLSIVRVVGGKVGENGIKADTWYCLDDNGEMVEAQS